MIQAQTRLKVADNSGAKEIQCIKVLGGSKKFTANIGDVIVASVKSAQPGGGEEKTWFVRSSCAAYGVRRKDGSYIRFDDNAAVIIDNQKQPGAPVYSARGSGAEREGLHEDISLAPEVL